MVRIGSLFAGVGGFDLAASWLGWETAWFSEVDPYACGVLVQQWPGVVNHGDIRAIDFKGVEPVDVLCGGFPCQDISQAGRGAGIGGSRSGLWRSFARAIRELRPRYVVVENVRALLGRGLDVVLGDLAEIGYDAEWTVLSAADVGAPHLRQRIWIVAYPEGQRGPLWEAEGAGSGGLAGLGLVMADAECHGVSDAGPRTAFGTAGGVQGEAREREWFWADLGERGDAGGSGAVADADQQGLEGRDGGVLQECPDERAVGAGGASLADATGAGLEGPTGAELQGPVDRPAGECDVADASRELLDGRGSAGTPGRVEPADGGGQVPDADDQGEPDVSVDADPWYSLSESPGSDGWWGVEPDVGRVAHGVPARVDRLKCLGNAIVPRCAAVIFQAIQRGLDAETDQDQ